MEGSKEEYLRQKEAEFNDIFGDGEIDLTATMTYVQGNRIEHLLYGAIIQEARERQIYQGLYNEDYNIEEAQQIIDELEKSQRDPITSGDNYQPTDIVQKLKAEK